MEDAQTELEKAHLVLQRADRLNSKNEARIEEFKSMEIEEARIKIQRDYDIKQLEKAKLDVVIEQKSLEQLISVATQKAIENKAEHDKITRSLNEAENVFGDIAKQRTKLQLEITRAGSEIRAANYLVNVEKGLQIIFRQALHNYIQLNGTEIKIPELNNKEKQFVIDFLRRDMGEIDKIEEPIETIVTTTSTDTAVELPGDPDYKPENDINIAGIKDLRRLYEEKFGKKPFMGWKEEQLIAKLI